MRDLDLGRSKHFSPHPLHPRHNIRLTSPFTHHPRIINRLQRSSLALRLRSAIIIPRRHQSPALSPLQRKEIPFQIVRRVILRIIRNETQLGTLAYTGILGYRQQYIRMLLFDRGGFLQLLANGEARHC